jgi:hypothetical protein
MSQFDFPRINFHGKALLDTATANNGYNSPGLTLFDQEHSLPFIPPRCYPPSGRTFNLPEGVIMIPDGKGLSYIPIAPINDTNYQDWAIVPLGSSTLDTDYHALYQQLQLTGYIPGYWNYFGSLSMELRHVKVTGITIPDAVAGTITYTQAGTCPAGLSDLLGAELSFNLDYGKPGSRTSAYLSDVDSIGQFCTQIFCSTAGLYDTNRQPLFIGNPVKSTARCMNLSRVLNWTFNVPMGGSASFYAMIAIPPDSRIAAMFGPYTTQPMQGLFMKLLIHEVYEVRNPDYSQLPATTMNGQGGPRDIPKNPTVVSVTGSITPWYANDMKTAPLSRIMKGTGPVTIDTTGIPNPLRQGSGTPLGIWPAAVVGPVHFIHNDQNNLLSLDFINAINEYGIDPEPYPPYSGLNDVAPFKNFVNYNFGTFNIYYLPTLADIPIHIGDITYEQYTMDWFLATGGVYDLPVTNQDFSNGIFFVTVSGDPKDVLREDPVYITTDQQGIYAEQNQNPAGLYMADGLPRIPFTLRVLNRGVPVKSDLNLTVTLQQINMAIPQSINKTQINVYDGMQYVFDVSQDGCLTYVFAANEADLLPDPMPGGLQALASLMTFAMRAYLAVLRVHASTNATLEPYLNGTLPITWDVVYANVFILYKTIYPVMDIILPMNAQTWGDTTIQQVLLNLISEENWNQPLYMPVTRDLTSAQRTLLQMWVQQSENTKQVKR